MRPTREPSGETRQSAREIFAPSRIYLDPTMKAKTSIPQMTRAEQETQTAAERLNGQIEDALAAVAVRSTSDTEELEACADRLERAARDMSAALRELAHERRMTRDKG